MLKKLKKETDIHSSPSDSLNQLKIIFYNTLLLFINCLGFQHGNVSLLLAS